MTESELQHDFAIKLEEKKWEFKTKELAYLEAGQHVRALNQVIWQVPGMIIAITGGLWFGLTLFEDPCIKRAILVFGLLINLITIIIVRRIRSVMDKYIDIQRQWPIPPTSSAGRKHTVVWCWTVILILVAILNALGATNVDALKKKASEERPVRISIEPGASGQTEAGKVSAKGG